MEALSKLKIHQVQVSTTQTVAAIKLAQKSEQACEVILHKVKMLVGLGLVSIMPQIGMYVLDKAKAVHSLLIAQERLVIEARTSYQILLLPGLVSILSAMAREVHLTRWAKSSTIRMTTGSLLRAPINQISLLSKAIPRLASLVLDSAQTLQLARRDQVLEPTTRLITAALIQ